MKNPFHYIQQYPKRTKQLLGISNEQFRQLLVQAEVRHTQKQADREKNKVRLNAQGGGCKPKLSLAEEVCLCLFYLRQLPTFEVLGLHFGISKTEANDTFHYWLKLLRELLPASLLEQVEPHRSDYALVVELLSQFRLTVDSFDGDKAYVGATNITTPHKKPRNRELTAEQKADNKVFSSQRIFIEHVIQLVKIFRIAKERFRLHPDTYEQVILTVCGLVRLRMGTLVLPFQS